MAEKVVNLRGSIKSWFGKQPRSLEQQNQDREYAKLLEEINQAKAEWAIAQQSLDVVSDPDLIDYAIYNLEAAERKYGYLLREAKKHQAKEQQILPKPLL